MKKLSPSSIKLYAALNDVEKRLVLHDLYHVQKLSHQQIADKFSTYGPKICREMRRLKIPTRSKAAAQTLALSGGRSIHPTRGKKRSTTEKIKIGNAVSLKWKNLTQEEYEQRRKQSQERWENLPDHTKQNIHKAANLALRKTAKDGSKLEHFVCSELKVLGYVVEFHKEHLLLNERLHLDIFLPKIKTAIEIDGPSHFLPMWGEEALQKTQKADREKAGLLLTAGCCLVRIKSPKFLSAKYKRELLEKLTNVLANIEKSPQSTENRYITLGD